jgi:hypothetical protein
LYDPKYCRVISTASDLPFHSNRARQVPHPVVCETEQRAAVQRVLTVGLTNKVAGEVREEKGRRNHTVNKTGKRLACVLPSGDSVTVAGREELTWNGFLDGLSEPLKAARKAKADGQPLDPLPGLLKAKAAKAKVDLKPRAGGKSAA